MKIGIVGAEESRWKPEQKEKALSAICDILHGLPIGVLDNRIGGNIEIAKLWTEGRENEITFVSGHCPRGIERWYCIDCQKFIDDDKVEEHRKFNSNGLVKAYDQGGIDTWVEIIATELGIGKEIYPAEVKQWNDQYVVLRQSAFESLYGYETEKKLKGYRSRNIQIAETCDVLYDIEPARSCGHCGGTGITLKEVEKLFEDEPDSVVTKNCRFCGGDGSYSGGTWTFKRVRGLGKPAYKVVIP